MRQRRNSATPEHSNPEHVLTDADIEEFGLEQAPDGIGPSWEEIIARRNPHGTE